MDMPADQSGAPEHRNIPPQEEASAVALQHHLVELQRTNRALRLLSSINQALIQVTTEDELMRRTCEIAVAIGGYRLAWVGHAEHDDAHTVRPICYAGNEQGYLHRRQFSWVKDAGCDPTGTAIRTGKVVILPDIAGLSTCAPWREAALARGYRAIIALPIHVDDQIMGALTLYDDTPHATSPEEVQLLTEIVGDLSYGITSLRMRARERQAEEALRQSEHRLRALIAAAPFGAHEYAAYPDGRLVLVGYNPAANRILGVDHARFLGLSIEEAFPALRGTALPEAYRRVARTGEAFEDEHVTYTHGEISGVFEISAFQTAPDRMAVFFRDITERKRTEDALRKNESMLRAIYNAALNVSLIITDINDDAPNVLEFSPGAELIFGYARSEMIGHPVNILHRPEDIAQFPEVHRAMREGKTGFSGETVLVRKNGERFPALFSTYPLFDEYGTMYAALGVTIDITAQKRVEQILRESEERLSLVIRNSPDLIYILDSDLRYIWAPKTVLNIHPENVLGNTDHDFFDAKEAERLDRINQRVMANGESIRYEKSIPQDSGTLYYENIALPWRDAQGHIIGVVVYAHDITERVLAERVTKRESAFLASAIELLPFPLFILTPSCDVIRRNRAGLALQQAPDTPPFGGVEFLDSQTHSPLPVPEWPINRALRGETVPTTECILRQHDGRELSILLQTAPIFINDELVAAVVAIQDITALREADRAKNQFLMVLSHEVKTPLTSIIGWAQLAQSAPDIVPEALATILRNANEQVTMLERLLILSRILTGKLVIAHQQLDLWQLALRASQRLRAVVLERQITFHKVPPDGDFHVMGDSALLEQAINEVLDNAINFTPNGGSITLRGAREDTMLRLLVSNTGKGIAPEQLPSLLKPFTQLQRQEALGGLGIGLALARGIIEAHRGRVTITSAGKDQGTTVTLCLPRAGGSNGEPGVL